MSADDPVVRLFRIVGSHTYDYSKVRFMDRLRLALVVLCGGRFTVQTPTYVFGKASQVSMEEGAR
jgi:hypothetical protein